MKVSNNSWEWRVFILQEKIMIMHPDILTWYSAVSQTFNISDNLDIVAHMATAWSWIFRERYMNSRRKKPCLNQQNKLSFKVLKVELSLMKCSVVSCCIIVWLLRHYLSHVSTRADSHSLVVEAIDAATRGEQLG